MSNDLFKNKYRILSARLKGWDYRSNGAYFITICTKNRKHYFGEITDNKMVLSNIGIIADILWHEIKNHTKNVDLDAFVVMPNHIHGIVVINKPDNFDDGVRCRDEACLVSTTTTTNVTNNNDNKNQFMSSISPKSGSISVIIGSYKSAFTRNAHRLGFEFVWQVRFHDHIIRNTTEYKRIFDYIIENPEKWNDDNFFD